MAKRSAKVMVAGLAVPIRVWAQRFAFLGFVADLVAAVPAYHLQRSTNLDELDSLVNTVRLAGRQEIS